MKIAVVGSGAVGGYYGGMLCRDNHQTHFLLRSDFDAVRRNGLRVLSPNGDFHVNPRCAKSPGEIGPADLVLVAIKTTGNNDLEALLKPLAGPQTTFLTLQNGLGTEEVLAAVVGADRVIGGLCFVCINRIAPGVIKHMDHGLVVMGEFGRFPEPRTHDIATAFRHAGIPCKVTDNLARTHWEKLVWNIPFNGLGVAAAAGIAAFHGGAVPPGVGRITLPSNALLADTAWHQLVKALMLEVIEIARAQAFDIPLSLADTQIERTQSMSPYKASTLLDFELGRRLELESIFLRPLAEARKLGIHAPILSRLCEVLQTLERQSPGL